MSEAVLSIKNANIFQGESLILSDVNITVSRSEFVYLVGKTGTGKSSLLKTLYGELPLKNGTANVAGFDLKDLTWKTVPFLRRNIGIVFQDFQLLTDRNVHDNLKFVLRDNNASILPGHCSTLPSLFWLMSPQATLIQKPRKRS